ncbi:MAG: dihydrodipicolinate synthase family protein [Devosia sp.]
MTLHYDRRYAKAWAREAMTGIWCAALNPFDHGDTSLDEAGLRKNLTHWFDDLGIDGVFVSGKQGEFFAMSVAERKRSFEVAVEVAHQAGKPRRGVICSCSDQNFDTVLELARHAEAIGADAIVVHAPILHFFKAQDETLLSYYHRLTEEVEIAVALWSHPDSGYLMSPDLCLQLARIDTVVAIKYSVPRPMYRELSERAGDTLIVSTASEDEWLDNIIELGWRLYLCSSPPYLIQTAADRRMREYTDLAFHGAHEEARKVSDSLDPVRRALKDTRPAEKPHAHQKYWQDLLGQTGGAVRFPMLSLTEAEKAATREALAQCGLNVPVLEAAAR